MTSTIPSPTLIRDLYTRMLLTRIVDDYTCKLHTQGFIDFVASCRGHEAAQVGSALCIEVGKDFTLPYYRDLGVVLTIGMTPHEIFRTYLQNRLPQHPPLPLARTRTISQDVTEQRSKERLPLQHWGYHKHNTVTGPAPVATQLLHAAGIAFASKLRKAPVVTIAYCGDGATTEPDFLEGVRFAAQHQLPVIFICEQAFTQQAQVATPPSSCMNSLSLPDGITHQFINGTDVVTVYQTMQAAMQHTREGRGPILLEMYVVRSLPDLQVPLASKPTSGANALVGQALSLLEVGGRRPFLPDQTIPKQEVLSDPLVCCQHTLQACGAWDDAWAEQLRTRISAEIECAWHDVLHDILQSS